MRNDVLTAPRPLPPWFDDAKFGLFVHWGPSSVAGYAPRSGRVWDVPDQFKENPYTEWYWNSLKIPGSSARRHHDATYGPDYPYENFADEFKRLTAAWDPRPWADLAVAAGARYVVPVTKHHDGFLLWPSAVRSPHVAPGYASGRDLIGDLAGAVRANGLRFGVYYSGGLDWPWHNQTIRSMADMAAAIPRDPAYADYAFAHWRDLIARYSPDCLWNDIYMPGTREQLASLFADYYAAIPEGVVNDRYKPRFTSRGMESDAHCDYSTPEYTVEADIREKKWECVRGIGHSFGFNREEGEDDYIKPQALVHLLVDIVSKNGNLLLNMGPRADGTIPELQRDRLLAVGRWLAINGEAIYATRPWRRAEGQTADGTSLRFTRRGDDLYVHVLSAPEPREWLIPDVLPPASAAVRILGLDGPATWRPTDSGMAVTVPPGIASEHAFVLAIRGAAAD